MCNLLSLSLLLCASLSLCLSATEQRIGAVPWFPLTQFLSFKHTLMLLQHILMLNMKLNNLWQNITHTHTPCHITCSLERAHLVTYRYDTVLFNWKVGTHLILGYFLCCCIVTAPRDGGNDWEQKTEGKEKERESRGSGNLRWTKLLFWHAWDEKLFIQQSGALACVTLRCALYPAVGRWLHLLHYHYYYF